MSDKNTCGMIIPKFYYTGPDSDDRQEDYKCPEKAIGITEDGVRVCKECSDGMIQEGFEVTFDHLVQ